MHRSPLAARSGGNLGGGVDHLEVVGDAWRSWPASPRRSSTSPPTGRSPAPPCAGRRPRPCTMKCRWMRVKTLGSVAARSASSSTTQSSTASRPFCEDVHDVPGRAAAGADQHQLHGARPGLRPVAERGAEHDLVAALGAAEEGPVLDPGHACFHGIDLRCTADPPCSPMPAPRSRAPDARLPSHASIGGQPVAQHSGELPGQPAGAGAQPGRAEHGFGTAAATPAGGDSGGAAARSSRTPASRRRSRSGPGIGSPASPRTAPSCSSAGRSA